MKTSLLPFSLLFVALPSHCQTLQAEGERLRSGKIESILRMQDLRERFDARLAALLSDGDPAVRRQAARACASLQDTNAIGPLMGALEDADSAAACAAAFALGQTGTALSAAGREALGNELIGKRLSRTRGAARLVEEIGKFGTAATLNDLMMRFAGAPPSALTGPLIMSVARFAIRGISSPDAVRFLLRSLRPGAQTPWQAVYALQRTGDNPVARGSTGRIRRLARSEDPLVRMNAATLLGKLRDSTGAADVLARLAGNDKDWRVRVNALKALGQFPWSGDAAVIATFGRAFLDGNTHVALTALSVFPSIRVGARDSTPETAAALRQLSAIAANPSGEFAWQLQAEAAVALAKIDRRIPRALISGSPPADPALRARLIAAAGESGDPNGEGLLFSAAAEENPLIVCAGLEALQAAVHRVPGNRALLDSVAGTMVRALTRRDMAIVATAAGVLGDSLFRRPSSVTPLLEALKGLHAPQDIEAIQDVLETLRQITGSDYSGMIVRSTEQDTTGPDIAFLRSLPPVVRVKLETARGEILIDLDTEGAPFTTMSIIKLSVQRKFYRGLTIHRVVPNFVVQGGDPRGDGWGGPGYALRSEFSMEEFGTGTVGIASAGKDTEGSQFFITHSPQPHLDGRYTVTGKVVAGMEVVDALQVGDRIDDLVVLP